MAERSGSDNGDELFAVQLDHVERPVRRLFLAYGRGRLGFIGVGIVMTVVAPVLELLPAYLLGVVVDAVFLQTKAYALPGVPSGWIPPGRRGQLYFSAGLIAGVVTLHWVVDWIHNWTWHVFARDLQHDLRIDAYDAMQGLGMEFFTEQRTGQLLSIVNSDVNELDDFLTDILRSVIQIVTRHLAMAAVLLSLNWQLALVALLPFPVGAAVSYRYSALVAPRYRSVREAVGRLTSRVENSVSGIEVVKSFTNEDLERERITAASREYRDANVDVLRVWISFLPTLDAIRWYGVAGVVLLGGIWIIAGPPLFFTLPLTVGTLVTFVIYSQRFVRPIIRAGQLLNTYHDAKASVERVFSLIDYPADVEAAGDARALESVDGRVVYDDVSFSYPGTSGRVLKGVDLAAEAGETVGIVGPTGSGKTTLLRLLLRLYDPDEGTVSVDGTDVRETTLQSLRDAVGYVSQDPFLFDGTIRENIRYGDPDADEEAVHEAAEAVDADEFVTDLEDGYGTRVGDRGVKLSGGQRQRIAIARAILKDPEILVLDEATSHVDNETEVLIQNSLAHLAESRTTFAIAHRLSTVRDADRILVLEEGRIVERGRHEALLERNGLYADLWRVQVGAVGDLPEEFLDAASTLSGGE